MLADGSRIADYLDDRPNLVPSLAAIPQLTSEPSLDCLVAELRLGDGVLDCLGVSDVALVKAVRTISRVGDELFGKIITMNPVPPVTGICSHLPRRSREIAAIHSEVTVLPALPGQSQVQ